MSIPCSPDDVLAQIPGWEDAVCTVLEGGLTNSVWKVNVDGRSAVLKMDEQPRQLPFSCRRDEAVLQNTAAIAGIAPTVILAEAGFILSEFVDGTVWSRDHLIDRNNLTQLGCTLRQIHDLPLTGRAFDPVSAATRYVEMIAVADARVVDRCTRIIEARCVPQKPSCCHNDLVVENLLTPECAQRSRLLFLDWEFACDNTPYFDLATIIEHHELDSAQVACLLDAYFDGDVKARIEALERQRALYLALLYLWMAARSDCDQSKLARVGERILTRNSVVPEA